MLNETQIIQAVNEMTYAQKLKVYIHYWNTITMLNLKGNMWFSGYHSTGRWGAVETAPTTISLCVLSRYHGRTKLKQEHTAQEFDDFTSAVNVKVTDHGENWKENGWSQRIDTRISGIYKHYYSFQKELNHA
jgi:hypothetical protein